MYQLQTRLIDILNYPLQDRITHLRYCIDSAPLKDLQSFFPALINSIFYGQNNIGWGLRTTTTNSQEYYLLYNFFNPHEAFFRLLYRLHAGFVKFEANFNDFPRGMRTMLENGRQLNSFYSSMINVDHFQPNKTLSMNAFEYFMLNFAIHGTKNLHKISPAAMNVNNENTMTVYFNLVADYLCNFLPGDPNQIIFPQIDVSPVKSPPPMQMPTIHPIKQPKYLLLSSLSHQQPQSPPQHNQSRDMRFQQENVRSSNWRSESVMMLFTDCWLRYDMDETYELPSNEQIRVLRIMVKQLHYFGNTAEQDTTCLSVLRQQSQALLNARMYPLLKSIMARWPLDSSFLNVLELWLSYIQKWRYIYNRNIQNLNADLVDIPEKFKTFMSENLICFTQIFIQNIPRFMKMDLSVAKNAYMLFRILKVFRQPSDILRELEKLLMNNTGRSHHSSIHDMSASLPRSPQQQHNSSLNRSSNSIHRHQSMNSVLEESSYVCMFSDEITHQIYVLMQRAFLAKLKIDDEVKAMEKQLQQNISLWERFLQFIGWLSSLNLSFSQALEEKKKAPVYLDFCLNILSPMYNIPIEDVTREFTANQSLAAEDSDHDETMNSDFLNITPSYMKSQLSRISYTGDPHLLPIMEYEVKFLVRFLYQLSSKLNEMFENELEAVWNNTGFTSRLARQILTPPVETKTFDKSQGYSELQVQHIGPRISFRKFANKKVLFALIVSFIIGRIFFGASSLGFLLFLFSCLFYLITKALISS